MARTRFNRVAILNYLNPWSTKPFGPQTHTKTEESPLLRVKASERREDDIWPLCPTHDSLGSERIS